MNKKIFLSIILILLAGCGFTPMLKNFDLSKLNVQKINYSGKNDLSYLIKTYLNIQETKSSQGMTVNILVSETISSATKNSAGITTEEDLTINIGLNVLDSKDKIIISDSFTSSKRLTVTNNLSSDEETRRIERRNLIQNLSQKIKFKLQLIAKQNQ
jgi:LPS-assembly lipoprotein